MAEYIEREKVHGVVRELQKYIWKNPDANELMGEPKYRVTVGADDVDFEVDKIPAADVAPVRIGRWVRLGKRATIFECSVCNKCEPHISDYCPNCGAKMSGGVDSEVD